MTGFSSRVGIALRILGAWLRLPLSKGGRDLLSWILGNGVLDAAARTGSLPQLTWSQDGEDLLFSELFPKQGFYVDVGANHPHRYSVTKRLYDLGWHGINVDFSPQFKTLFDRERPQDINIEALVGKPGMEIFYIFEESTLSTLNKARADQLIDLGWKLIDEIEVPVKDLNEILMNHISCNTRI